MSNQKVPEKEYLSKDFDYTKLTKQELRAIMSENGVEDIPPLTSLKSTIIEAYKTHIHDRIDQIKSSFSSENVFQRDQDKSFRSDQDDRSFTMKSDKSFTKNNDQDKSFSSFTKNNDQDSFKSNQSSFINKKSQIDDSSEINSTSFNKKQKMPFIAIPKKRDEIKPIPAVVPPKVKISRSGKSYNYIFKIFIVLIISWSIYSKFYCPYCRPGIKLCIPPPKNSKVVGNELICDKGYILSRGIVDICVPDTKAIDAIAHRGDSFIKMLEYLNGDYVFGFAKSPKINISVISEPEVLKYLRDSGKVVFLGDSVEAKASKVRFGVLIRFYSIFFLKIILGLVLLVIVLKIIINRRKKTATLKAKALTLSKEILDILNRQIMMSLKSSQFKPYVLSLQIKDALDIKDDVWQYVSENIVKNSNVEKTVDDKGKTVWKWIGPVLYKTESIDVE